MSPWCRARRSEPSEHVRISYATSMEELRRGLDRIDDFIASADAARSANRTRVCRAGLGTDRAVALCSARRTNAIGEVWFPLRGDFPLLVKFIFTSERLSVQVHPRDEYARTTRIRGARRRCGTSCAAEPGADHCDRIPASAVDNEQLRAAIADGSVEELLNWVPVQAGRDIVHARPAWFMRSVRASRFARSSRTPTSLTGCTITAVRVNCISRRDWTYSIPCRMRAACPMPVACEHFVTEKIDLLSRESSELDQRIPADADRRHGYARRAAVRGWRGVARSGRRPAPSRSSPTARRRSSARARGSA